MDATRSVLLLMDFQNYGLHPDGYWAKRDPDLMSRIRSSKVLENAGVALTAARTAGMPVVHVVNRWRPGHGDLNPSMPMFADRIGSDIAVEGTWGAEIVDELQPLPTEPVVAKRSVSALTGTELPRLLTLIDARTLVLTGIATNFVVEGTAREAADRGYDVVVIKECCETYADDAQRVSLELMAMLGAVISLQEFVGSPALMSREPPATA